MNRMPTLRQHGTAVILALVVAFACVAPEFYNVTRPGYAGIPLFGTDAETHYAARIAEAMRPAPQFGNVYLPGGDRPYFIPALGERLTALLGFVTGQGAAATVVLAKFVFPFLVALLFYVLVFMLFKSRRIALLGATAVMLGDNLMSSAGAWADLLRGASRASQFITYARPVNPEVSELFLLGALLLFCIAFLHGSRPRWRESAAFGALTGLVLFISPYIASFLVVFGLGWFLWFSYRRQWHLAGHLVFAGLVAGVCMIPFFLNYRALVASPLYSVSALRQGLIATHAPILGIWLIVLLIIVIVPWPRRLAPARPLFFASVLALLVLLNQQIITGRALQASHYHWYIEKPLVLILASAFAVVLLDRLVQRAWIKSVAVGGMIALLAYNATLVQAASYRTAYPEAKSAQAYVPVFTYLSTLPDRQAVWADRKLSNLLPIYAPVAAVNSKYAEFYLADADYLSERLFLEYRLRGVSAVDALAVMKTERADISNQIFGIYYRDQFGDYSDVPDTLLAGYAKAYAAFLKKPEEAAFRDLGVSLVVWDTAAEPSWRIDRLAFAREVFASGTLRAYRLSPAP